MTKTTADSVLPSRDEIIATVISNYKTLLQILESLDDEQINRQLFPTKRTIAEIAFHIIQAESLPIRVHRFIDFLLGNNPKFSSGKPIDASDYAWDTSKGKNRKPKSFKRDKLILSLQKIQQKKVLQYQQINNNSRKYVHHYVRHVSIHRKQIQILVSKL